jgi:hypothetical protein
LRTSTSLPPLTALVAEPDAAHAMAPAGAVVLLARRDMIVGLRPT